MFKIKKPLIAAVSMALGLGMAANVQAAAEFFDTHDADGVITIGGFDWAPTSFLAQGGVAAINNFILTGGACPAGSCVFNVLTQTNLGSFLDVNGDAIGGLSGLNNRYQVTMILKYQEMVASVSGSTVNFANVTTGPTILEIYYDKNPPTGGTKSVPLTGFGFNDGTLILKSTSIGPATGHFTADPAAVILDQHGPDNYPGQLTQTGSGANGILNWGTLTQDFAFFKNDITHLDINNISQSLPFNTVDPMDCFTNIFANLTVGTSNPAYACDSTHVLGPYAVQTALAGGYVPVTGPVNGLLPIVGGTGTDFVGQTDFNGNIAGVPEPTSLALMGLGLGFLGFGASRRRHPKKGA